MLRAVAFEDWYLHTLEWDCKEWFCVDQVAKLIFGMQGRELVVKMREFAKKSIGDRDRYNIREYSNPTLLDQFRSVGALNPGTSACYLIEVDSLKLYMIDYCFQETPYQRLRGIFKQHKRMKSANLASEKRKEGGKWTLKDRIVVAARQGYTCAKCGQTLSSEFEVHHTESLHLGGSNSLEKGEALCRNCHAKLTELDRQKIRGHYVLSQTPTTAPPAARISKFFQPAINKKKIGH